MKIAFIYDAVYPWVKGGAEKRIYEIGKNLAKNGHEVHWYGIGWWQDKEKSEIEMDGIHFHGVCKPIQLYNDDGKRSIKEAIYFSLKLFPLLIKEEYDIIDCQNFPFFPFFIVKFYSVLRRKAIVLTFHEVWGDYWYEYLGKKGIFGKLLEKTMVKMNHEFIAVSKSTEKQILNIKKGLNIKIIPNGINNQFIKHVIPSNEKSDVIFVGRLIKDKNVDYLIKAVSIVKKELKDVKCIIIGDGPEKDHLKILVKDLMLEKNIKFVDFLNDYDDLIAVMKSSKVFVLPSTREGFGIVVLEANACGLPVITIDHPRNAASDLINNNHNGYTSKISPEEISRNIIKCINNKKHLEENCIKFSKGYEWELITKKIENHYLSILDR